LLEIHPSLDDETIVYRTGDFFSVAQLVTEKKLMFSRADTFPDKNEGVDHLLGGLERTFPKSGCGIRAIASNVQRTQP
jgi:hypothetical protein